MALDRPLLMSMEKEEQLSKLGYRISATFSSLEILLARSGEQDILSAPLENAKQRFNLWAINLGLYVPGHSSLEYRLGDAPLVYSYTRKSLADLQKYLEIVVEALQKKDRDESVTSDLLHQSRISETLERSHKEDSDSSDDEDFETYQDDSFAATALENVNGLVDRLYRLGFKIRNPATRVGFTKAQNYQEIDQETDVDLIHIFASFDLQHVEQVFLQSQGSLDRESIKKNFLVKRLARANTRRRQQFKQWRSHRIKIEASSKHAREFNFLIPSSKEFASGETPIPEATVTAAKPAPSMPSTATRVDPAMVAIDDTASIVSSSTYARFSNDPSLTLEIPQLPRKLRLQKDFECPYCHVLCSGRTGDPRSWNQHVLRDLRPYICTYKDCKDGDQQYDSFKQWLSHETHNHRIARRCKEHPEESFPSLNEWREHVASHHLDAASLDHLDINETCSSSSDKKRCCPICAEEAVNHEHVGRHLQQIALFALPKSTGFEDDSALDDNSSVATVDDLEQEQLDNSDMLSVSNEERRPPEAVYGVDFNDVGNMLGELDPFQLAYNNRDIDGNRYTIYNPKIPRTLDVELKHNFSFDDCLVTCVKFSPDAQYIAVGLDQTAIVYEVETGSERTNLKLGYDLNDDEMFVRGLCFDDSGVYLAIASDRKPIRIFHIDSGKLHVTLTGHEGNVFSVEFIANSNFLLSCGEDSTVRLWDAQTGAEISNFLMGRKHVSSIATSTDGQFFAASTLDGTAKVWNLEGELLHALSSARPRLYSIYDIDFSPDGRTVVMGYSDGICKIWNLSDGMASPSGRIDGLKPTLIGHKELVRAATFTKDGRWVVSGSMDRGIQIWDPVTGDAVLRIEGHGREVVSLDTSSIGNYIASGSFDGSVNIWRYRYRREN